ncbi:chromobox protein homolog 7 isoform X11 [Callithrix jacchus]|uniref:chromobox protein homolog 7 isoform X2 n=1 Tax=Callithrix jacchus TaxID=9483 RepID=UPI0023DD2934|nr:chromobox protein homolog 7 isoform X2 [Callithrix jacchus]
MVFLIRGSFQLEWGLELGGWPGSVGFWGASPCPQGRLRHSSAAPPKPRSPPRPQERPAGGGGPAPAAPLPTPCPHPSVSSPARPGSGETARACLPGVGRGGAVTWPCLSRSWRAPSLSRPRPRLLGLPVILVRAPLRACARPPTAGAGPGRYAPSHRALGSRPAGTASPMQSPRSPSIHAAGCSSQATYSTWEPEEHILDPRLVMAYEEKEQRTGEADAFPSLRCHQCFLFFCHLLHTPGRRETERRGIGREVRNPSGFCCSPERPTSTCGSHARSSRLAGPTWRATAIDGSSSCRSNRPQMSCRRPASGSLLHSPLKRRQMPTWPRGPLPGHLRSPQVK